MDREPLCEPPDSLGVEDGVPTIAIAAEAGVETADALAESRGDGTGRETAELGKERVVVGGGEAGLGEGEEGGEDGLFKQIEVSIAQREKKRKEMNLDDDILEDPLALCLGLGALIRLLGLESARRDPLGKLEEDSSSFLAVDLVQVDNVVDERAENGARGVVRTGNGLRNRDWSGRGLVEKEETRPTSSSKSLR